MTGLLRRFLMPIALFSNNVVSKIGIYLVTAATVLWIFSMPSLVRGETPNPYAGILLLVILPAMFFLGLGLIPVGAYMRRRAAAASAEVQPLVIDFRSPSVRSLVTFIAVATALNVVIGSQLAYSSVNYVEGVSFCGTTCHVMRPEYVAYQRSVHARVECVKCHASPGVRGFVETKMSGLRQLVDVTANTYPRPIPPPANPLHSSETCERCHDRSTDHGDRLRVISKFADDEKNTRADTVLVMHVGGGSPHGGIHGAHLSAGVEIEFATDPENAAKVLWVRHKAADGSTTVYLGAGVTSTDTGRRRTMECLDCHNRVGHPFELPDRAVDRALADGEISPALPFAKREAVRILKGGADDPAVSGVKAAFQEFYAQNYGSLASRKNADIEKGGEAVEAIYRRNVFPAMKLVWGSHPDNLGHTDAPGCWRCHDDAHKSKDGRTIPQDCGICHHLAAMEEAAPKVLDDLGIATGIAAPSN